MLLKAKTSYKNAADRVMIGARSSQFICACRAIVPTFLSTKLLPRNDGELLEKRDSLKRAEEGENNHVDDVARFNESVVDISTSYQAAADNLLRGLGP